MTHSIAIKTLTIQYVTQNNNTDYTACIKYQKYRYSYNAKHIISLASCSTNTPASTRSSGLVVSMEAFISNSVEHFYNIHYWLKMSIKSHYLLSNSKFLSCNCVSSSSI